MGGITQRAAFGALAGADQATLRLRQPGERVQEDEARLRELPERALAGGTDGNHGTRGSSNTSITDYAVTLEHVAKAYGARKVLTDFSLRIERGSFCAIVGRSGCGKSTLLRIVAGLERPDSGVLRTAGATEQIRTRIMFQEPRLLPWKTVLQNVMLGLPASAKTQARGVLADVGLEERAGDWPAQLSGGQKQRVALARALVHRPELLLLDEPLGALDALTRIEMHALIERLWREHGFTALLVTHDVHEAVALADRVLLIENGELGFDQRVAFPRPRKRTSAELAALEENVLLRVLRG